MARSSMTRIGLRPWPGMASARPRPTARMSASSAALSTAATIAGVPSCLDSGTCGSPSPPTSAPGSPTRWCRSCAAAATTRCCTGPSPTTERDDWAWCAEAAARDVADGRAEQAVVCCWTGTGASIAANKVDGVRAALCADAQTADGARRWNDANVLALSLRTTSEAQLVEILDAWFAGAPSDAADDAANVAHVAEIER